MNRTALIPLVLAAASLLAACGIFRDKLPETARFRMDGPAGAPVWVALSTEFAAGVDETGTTRVQVFTADTVRMQLPIDTVVDIADPQRFFVQAWPAAADSLLNVRVEVDVDDRNQLRDVGILLLRSPFVFAYVFGLRLTVNIDVL